MLDLSMMRALISQSHSGCIPYLLEYFTSTCVPRLENFNLFLKPPILITKPLILMDEILNLPLANVRVAFDYTKDGIETDDVALRLRKRRIMVMNQLRLAKPC